MALDGGRTRNVNGFGETLAAHLQTARDLIARLDDEVYSEGAGSIGAHIRHNLNFVEAVIAGASTGVIDYSRRTRDHRIETDRHAAIERIDELAAKIEGFVVDLNTPLSITSELEPAIEHSSSLGRELEFVISHTIHHHALIRERLQLVGFEFDETFGVAPSTLEYRDRAGQ